MSELPHEQTFKQLTQFGQPSEFRELFGKSLQLLDAAYDEQSLPEYSRNSHFRHFTDALGRFQGFWEIQKYDNTYPRDRLSINLTDTVLALSIHYADNQPNRNLVIGEKYARFTESNTMRAHTIAHLLRDENDRNYEYNPNYAGWGIAQFSEHLDTSIALMGLVDTMRRTKETYEEAA